MILTGIIRWVLVVLASHDGVRRKRDGEVFRVILRQQARTFILLSLYSSCSAAVVLLCSNKDICARPLYPNEYIRFTRARVAARVAARPPR